MLLGGIWTWWNYRQSRTYAQKLDLQVGGETFVRGDLYVEVEVTVKNLGSAKHLLQPKGSSCILTLIFDDLSERTMRGFPVFALQEHIEPGETIADRIAWKITLDSARAVWLRLDLRVLSGRVEWNAGHLVRVGAIKTERDQEEI